MNETSSAPLPPPDDPRILPASPSRGGSISRHSLFFGFLGQMVLTVLQFVVAYNTHGSAGALISEQLALLIIPLAFALLGAFTARKRPVSFIEHPIVVAVVTLLVGILGVYNLIIFLIMLKVAGIGGCC